MLSFVCTIFFIAFGITGLWNDNIAYAATTRLTPTDTRTLVGDTIPAKYYNGTDYVDFNFVYGGSTTVDSFAYLGDYTPMLHQGDNVIWYSAHVSPSANPQYITVDINPQYSFFDTDLVQMSCGCGVRNGTTISSASFSSPSWRWTTSYSGAIILENMAQSNGVRAMIDLIINGSHRGFTFVDADLTNNGATFSAYSYRACFYGNTAVSTGDLYFFVSCPVISDDSTMASGTFGTTTSGSGSSGDVNVTVDVDMSETNGLLETIAGLLSGLVNGIKDLFIPSQQDIEDFKTALDTLMQDKFGAFWASQSLLRQAVSQLGSIQMRESIRFPGVTIDVGDNQTFTLAAQDVPLNPASGNATWSTFLESVRLAFDIVSTLLVINMLKDKLQYIINHPRRDN